MDVEQNNTKHCLLPQEFMSILLLTSNSCKIPPMLFQGNWKVFLKISIKFGIFFSHDEDFLCI